MSSLLTSTSLTKWCHIWIHFWLLKKVLRIIKFSQTTFPLSGHLEFQSTLRNFWSIFDFELEKYNPDIIGNGHSQINEIEKDMKSKHIEQENFRVQHAESMRNEVYSIKSEYSIKPELFRKSTQVISYTASFLWQKQVILMINWKMSSFKSLSYITVIVRGKIRKYYFSKYRIS